MMSRRRILQIGAGGLLGSMVPSILRGCSQGMPVYSGWQPDQQAFSRFIRHTRHPYMAQSTPTSFKGSGKGRVVLLHKYLEEAIGKIVPHDQEIGDCVGQAYGMAVDILSATQIHGFGLPEDWIAKASTETAYAGSRYEIGYEQYGNRRILRGDGSLGIYAAEFLKEYGVLLRQKYGTFDLTKYDPRLAKDWGRHGVPDELEPVAKQHPIRSFALVRTYNEVRDAICNGYPVVFCSNYGFNPDCRRCNPGGRDSMGFLARCGRWYHAMCGIGVDDGVRPGVLLINSWGLDWVSGPTRLGMPAGSFWVDAENIDGMASHGDTCAISGFIGFPSQTLDYNLF